jgi:hypothetical protein
MNPIQMGEERELEGEQGRFLPNFPIFPISSTS